MNRARFTLGLSLIVGSTIGVSCDDEAPQTSSVESQSSAEKAPTDRAPSAKATKTVIELPPGDGPVAKVNGAPVPRELFNREYRQTMERYQRARHEVKPALRERLKDNIIRRLVDAEVIRQQAKKLEIEVPVQEMTEKWNAHKKRYGSEEAFAAFLDRAGTTANDVKRTFETNLLRERVFAEVSKNVMVEPGEAQAFYKENEKRYQEPEQVRASHILFRVPAGASSEQRTQKTKLAEDVLARLKKGERFDKLAKEFGEDPTKARGGDLGFFTRGRMVKPFEEAVWKLDKGALSGLVRTQFGIHLIKKTDHRPRRKKAFSEVREQIERSLLARKRNQAIRESLDTWKKTAKIEIMVKGDAKIIAAGQSRPAAPGAQKRQAAPQSQPQQLQLMAQPAIPNPSDAATQ